MFLDGAKQETIAKAIGLSQVRISQILYANRALLNYDQNYEKVKRINRLKRIADNLPETVSKNKDVLDVQAEIRKEIEGEEKSGNTINNITYNLNGHRKENRLIPEDAS